MTAPALLTFRVDGIGEFEFRKRNFNDEATIEMATRHMLGGAALSGDDELRRFCRAISTLRILLVTKPDGWDLEELDPLDPDDVGSAMRAFGGLRAAEDEFRKRAKAARPALGTAA